MFYKTRLNGRALSGAPVTGPITGGFGDVYENAAGKPYTHIGVDIGVPVGTPVYAAAGGTIYLHQPGDGWGDGSFGNCAAIDVPGTPWYVLTAHMSAFETQNGRVVQAGDLIGWSGNTGMSTGPHVHWQVSSSPLFPHSIGLCVDPLTLIADPEDEPMNDQDKAAISAEIDQKLNAAIDGFSGIFRQLLLEYFADGIPGDFADAEGNPIPPDPRVVASLNEALANDGAPAAQRVRTITGAKGRG